uniref:AB hydrolase-1 domain-containing protein n=1 Tax=Astyanax mexicanus TaxID=7994 RepID=A0A3B1KEP1_ASTMX
MASAFISVSSGKKSVNGVELYYQQVGEAEHPVLLLTGKESKITDIKPMNRFCGVFGPSRLWMFASPRQSLPLNFFHRDAKDVVNLMHELGFRHFSLLGWSDGGITALIAAALNPTLIKKMVVWGSNAYVSEQDSLHFRQSSSCPAKRDSPVLGCIHKHHRCCCLPSLPHDKANVTCSAAVSYF